MIKDLDVEIWASFLKAKSVSDTISIDDEDRELITESTSNT